MPSQADWVKLIIFSCRNESISSAQQLSISTVTKHLIQLNFTQDIFIADNLDVTAVAFKQINFTFSWNLLCPPRCGQCWLPDWRKQITPAASGTWPSEGRVYNIHLINNTKGKLIWRKKGSFCTFFKGTVMTKHDILEDTKFHRGHWEMWPFRWAWKYIANQKYYFTQLSPSHWLPYGSTATHVSHSVLLTKPWKTWKRHTPNVIIVMYSKSCPSHPLAFDTYDISQLINWSLLEKHSTLLISELHFVNVEVFRETKWQADAKWFHGWG